MNKFTNINTCIEHGNNLLCLEFTEKVIEVIQTLLDNTASLVVRIFNATNLFVSNPAEFEVTAFLTSLKTQGGERIPQSFYLKTILPYSYAENYIT